ncbi:Histone-fold [Sesbania bispinosa]|nr:Histone-fold [Sesbania bispinosa]
MSGKGAKGLITSANKDKDKDKKKPISRSSRAGLQFPVGRIHRLLKSRTTSNGEWEPRLLSTLLLSWSI